MIGFILGTSEGRKILSLINKYTHEIAVTTATIYGGELLKEFNIKVLNTKPLNKEEMSNWIRINKIDVLVDASHPYAQEVTKTASECANDLKIQYVRYERQGILENITGEDIIRVKNYDEAIEIIKKIDGNILNTTGGNNVSKFLRLDFKYRIIHRILPSPKVLASIVEVGISIKDIIALQGPPPPAAGSTKISQSPVPAPVDSLRRPRASTSCVPSGENEGSCSTSPRGGEIRWTSPPDAGTTPTITGTCGEHDPSHLVVRASVLRSGETTNDTPSPGSSST